MNDKKVCVHVLNKEVPVKLRGSCAHMRDCVGKYLVDYSRHYTNVYGEMTGAFKNCPLYRGCVIGGCKIPLYT